MPINSFLYPGAKVTPAYEVDNSCMFNDNDTAYMHKTPSSSWNQRTFTFSTWWKQGDLASSSVLFASGEADGDPNFAIYFSSSEQLNVLYYEGSSLLQLVTNAQYRDPSGWYHICVAIDTTQSTNTDRAKIYINGSQVTSLGTATNCNQNVDISINTSSYRMAIGAGVDNGDVADGYAAETVFIDGSALAQTSFGEFDEDSPQIWKPVDVSGLTFGTNGFYLDYEDSSNLGNDKNGGTDLTEVNLAATAQSTDTCTVNYPVMNPLDAYWPTTNAVSVFSEGNLHLQSGTGSNSSTGYSYNNATFTLSASKWYWEVKPTNLGGSSFIGIISEGQIYNQNLNEIANSVAYAWTIRENGNVRNNNANITCGSSYTTNDIIGVALDLDNNKIYFSKNGDWADGSGSWGSSTFNASTGAITITAPASNGSGHYFPTVGASDYAQSSTFQLNFGSAPYTI